MFEKSEDQNALREVREHIDEIDNKILGLLAMRARLSVVAGKLKNGGPIHRPGREDAILDRLCTLNKSPELTDAHIRRLWTELFAISREMQNASEEKK